MTPLNIVMMAKLKGLDAIAVTDHQSAGNIRAFAEAAEREGLMLLPGLEICTKEEVHLLAYFETVEAAEEMGEYCRTNLPPIPNRPSYFGNQILMNALDEPQGEEKLSLITALFQDLSAVSRKVRDLGGVPVPAHINRGNNGLLGALGFIPPEEGFTAFEVARELPLKAALGQAIVLNSSDAHQLGAISERESFLSGVNDPRSILACLSGKSSR